ncbi:hypothetical protein TR51_03005 [Kitasatospora griseola]|uniref:Gram-positive cocci surface proteins LPxTG domain-containing protein n=1 Tax=Kitasatospora griseola TaxID=2064 RepID=A0A0D0Q1X2_KITGR|nr:hypothetical protein [Kitasatospora griseola]KIQ66547.1 hypothetical protein TR51_03005 [Kitasatospora griseola]
MVDGDTTATPSAQPSPSATAWTTRHRGTPATQAAHLGAETAETGAGDTVRIAVGGAAILVFGAGMLVALRRRRGPHS